MATKIAVGNARDKLRLIHNESINCSVTSPAYWMLRNYHAGPGEIGREPTIRQYIDNLLQVIDEIYRVLMPHGTLWLNLGDTYSTQAGNSRGRTHLETGPIHDVNIGDTVIEGNGMPPKSLCLIPYRVAIAMVDRGWIVRNAVIWHKPDGMPESVQDRFTVDYEPVFFCAKNPQYYFKQQLRPDAENTLKDKDRPKAPLKRAKNLVVPGRTTHGMHIDRAHGHSPDVFNPAGANLRCVWKIPTARFHGAHFAVFPERLVETCIEAGCPPGGIVLDPFLGSGTVAVVAERLGRTCYGIELNPEFAKQARERILAARATRRLEPGLPALADPR